MRGNSIDGLATAMIQYLQSTGFSRSQLAEFTEMPTEQIAAKTTDLSPRQLTHLWQLVQARFLPTLSFSVQVRSMITDQLNRGRVRAAAVAEQLNMSRQTLYKKLKQENLTFATLLEDVRREQALAYLQDRNRPLTEVAELLGFSELSAFSRAFKRWMGQSPAHFRAANTR